MEAHCHWPEDEEHSGDVHGSSAAQQRQHGRCHRLQSSPGNHCQAAKSRSENTKLIKNKVKFTSLFLHDTTCMWVVLRVTLWIHLFVIIQMKFQTLLLCGIVNRAVQGGLFHFRDK